MDRVLCIGPFLMSKTLAMWRNQAYAHQYRRASSAERKRNEGSSNSCATISMNLNFKTKEFYLITRNAGGDCKVYGITLEKLHKPLTAQIVDRSKIISDEQAKIEKAAFHVLATDFQRKVGNLGAQVRMTKGEN